MRHGVVAVICRADGRLLVIERAAVVPAPGAFCFPGGGIEPGESEDQALCREVREELAVDIVPLGRLWQSTTSWGVALSWWSARLEPAEAPLTPNPLEVASVRWLSVGEMRALPKLLSSNIEFLEAAAAWLERHARP